MTPKITPNCYTKEPFNLKQTGEPEPSCTSCITNLINRISTLFSTTYNSLCNRVSTNITALRRMIFSTNTAVTPYFKGTQKGHIKIQIHKDNEISAIKKLYKIGLYLNTDKCFKDGKEIDTTYLENLLNTAYELDIPTDEPHLEHLINSYRASLIDLLSNATPLLEKNKNTPPPKKPNITHTPHSQILPIEGDGNCLFRSISVALHLKGIRQAPCNEKKLEGNDHDILRKESCDYIKKHITDKEEIQFALLEDYLSSQLAEKFKLIDLINTYRSPEIALSDAQRKIRLNKAHYELEDIDNSTQEDYLKKLENSHFYAGAASLISLSHIYNVAIRTRYINPDVNVPDQVYNEGEGRPEITLTYSGNHYEVLSD